MRGLEPKHMNSLRQLLNRPFEVNATPPCVLLGALAALMLLASGHAAQTTSAIVAPHSFAVPGLDAGELWLGELNCVACHPADAAAKGRLKPRPGPVLDATGLRLTP